MSILLKRASACNAQRTQQSIITFAGPTLQPTEDVISHLPFYILVLPATSKFVYYL